MRTIRMAVLAGGATMLLAGAAMAASHDMHVMKVALPDGSEAQISYQGDVAPKIRIAGGPSMPVAFVPLAGFDMAPFAEMDRVAAMIDRQADLAMQRAAMMQRAAQTGGAPMTLVAGKSMPGTVSYSYVSTTTSEGGCTRTVSWSTDGANAQPKMTKTSAGSCAGTSAHDPAQPLQAVAPAAPTVLPKTRT
jgi:hypothetical protein